MNAKQLYSKLISLVFFFYNHLPFNNCIKVRHNVFNVGISKLKKCNIRTYGVNNTIIIGDGCNFKNCKITIYGNNNKINISDNVIANQAEFYIEEDNNEISFDKDTTLAGKIQLACTEGSRIIVEEDCIFSSEIVIRTGDSHSILDMEGKRINPAKAVIIHKHVWVGYRALICKGVEIPPHSVVGTGSVVTKSFLQANSCIAGNPAKIVKENIDWKIPRK